MATASKSGAFRGLHSRSVPFVQAEPEPGGGAFGALSMSAETFVRFCLKHRVPLRPDASEPMRCELGHPVEDHKGWAVVDTRTGKIVAYPSKVEAGRTYARRMDLGRGGRS